MMLLRSVKVIVELEQVTVDEDDGDDSTPLCESGSGTGAGNSGRIRWR